MPNLRNFSVASRNLNNFLISQKKNEYSIPANLANNISKEQSQMLMEANNKIMLNNYILVNEQAIKIDKLFIKNTKKCVFQKLNFDFKELATFREQIQKNMQPQELNI